MRIGKVVGNVWATKKDENLSGLKLLIVKVMVDQIREAEGFIVASDIVGAGEGDLVLLSQGGGARHAVGNPKAPVDCAIVGIVDSIEVASREYE